LECSHSPVWAGTRVKCLILGVEENLLLPSPSLRPQWTSSHQCTMKDEW
jgi:hypothetical protein